MATAAPVHPAAPHTGIRALLARHPLVSFFVLAYAGTWLFELPYVLSGYGVGLLPTSSPVLLWTAPVSVFMGPFLAAFVMTGATEGREGVRRLLRRFVLWRVGFRWYLFAFVGIPVIAVLSVVVIPGVLGSFQGLGALAPLSVLGIFVYVLFLGGALGEEPGWRGFALPRLQSLHGPLLGSLILGPLWALWHLPLFFTPWNELTAFNVVVFVLATTCLAIMYTWVFNNTKGSVLMAILIHASFNGFVTGILTPLFPAPILSDYGLLPILGGFGVFAVVLVALTRGRLGYQHYQQDVLVPATAHGKGADEIIEGK
jgi:membrane protease YdiL (CAAX protease family)